MNLDWDWPEFPPDVNVPMAARPPTIEVRPGDVCGCPLRTSEQRVAQARSYILLSQWDKAAAEYAKVDYGKRPLGDDADVYACLFLILGDSEGYDRFCQGMI